MGQPSDASKSSHSGVSFISFNPWTREIYPTRTTCWCFSWGFDSASWHCLHFLCQRLRLSKNIPSRHQFLYINKWGLALSPMTIPFQQNLAGYCLCIFQDMPIKYQTCWYPDSAHVLYRTTSVDQQTQKLLLQLISPWLNMNIVQARL